MTNTHHEILDSESNPRKREIRERDSKLVISDDRNKEVELIDPVTINVFGTFNSDTHEDKLRNVRDLAKIRSSRAQKITYPIYMAILIITIFVMMFGFLVWSGSFGSLTFGIIIFVYACYSILQGCRQVTRGLKIKNARNIMTAMMQEGLCLSCAYDICGLRIDTDDCVVCPECGSAWRIKDLPCSSA